MPGLRGNKWAVKKGWLKEASGLLAMFGEPETRIYLAPKRGCQMDLKIYVHA